MRTLRLDRSDQFIFERAAASGEWAVAGAFMFWDLDPTTLSGQARAAFRSGFLGVASHGWSTLAEIVDATDADHESAIATLATLIVERLGAPDLTAARAAAAEEIVFASSLCDHPAGTVIALQRAVDDDGEIRERFRTLKPTLAPQANTFAQGCVQPIGVSRDGGLIDEATSDLDPENIVGEEVDFIGLMRTRPDGPDSPAGSTSGSKERS